MSRTRTLVALTALAALTGTGVGALALSTTTSGSQYGRIRWGGAGAAHDVQLTRTGGQISKDAPPPSSAAGSGTSEVAPYALDQTFLLHTRPGSTRKIYLDFTGNTTSGTQWNSDFTNGNPLVSAPFDIDGKAGFSAAEDAVVQKVWQSVREDFAPFDVDVTTQDPGVEALRKTSPDDTAYGERVVISPTASWYPDAGGVGYYYSFTRSVETPVFVFTDLSQRSKFIGEAAAHEVGHSLGLHHDGSPAGEYFAGQGSWAPIMGNSYSRTVTQWSKGEYDGANNTEDDLAVITSNGLSYRPDDVLGTADTTATLPAGTVRYGVLERTGDVDAYKFSIGSSHTLRLRGWNNVGTGIDANLNLRGVLRTSTGVLKASANSTTGQGFDTTVTLPPGTYVLYLNGMGEGSPATTGYSSYDSLGHYGVELTWA